ncbi:hypothetical protein DSO57_1034886 [Entomophthora muscae]|uniref:Uncharacterized protein n=1 Tax=Entomophthora muscae TaxID=34485 RepID=A0ACC2TLM6_9FUNG|nr:hypothetical protein DSO57_1034886 [Entomophthora muscae]
MRLNHLPPSSVPHRNPLNTPPTTGVGGLCTSSFDPPFRPLYLPDPSLRPLVPTLKREEIDSSALAALISPSRDTAACPSSFSPPSALPPRDHIKHVIPPFSTLDSVARLGPRFQTTPSGITQLLPFPTPRSYTCMLCPQTFGRKNSLRRHEKLHSGEKPYRCDQCSKSFSRRDILLRHATSRKCQALKVKSHSPHDSPNHWQDEPQDPDSK